jgi:hypothetical protein
MPSIDCRAARQGAHDDLRRAQQAAQLIDDRALDLGRRYPVQSPYIAIANRQAEIMLRIASEFGFTPASRSRIATPSPTELSLFDLMEDGPAGRRAGGLMRLVSFLAS